MAHHMTANQKFIAVAGPKIIERLIAFDGTVRQKRWTRSVKSIWSDDACAFIVDHAGCLVELSAQIAEQDRKGASK